MPKPTKGPRLGSSPTHQRQMLAGMAAALIREERIRTTETRAKRLRPLAEKLITMGKEGTVQARRRALSVIEDREVVHKLFAEIAPRFEDRSGGYTRILKLGPRNGDAAPMALIELVEEAAFAETGTSPAAKSRGRLLRRRKAAGEAEEAAPRRRRGRAAEAPAAEAPAEATEDATAEAPAEAPAEAAVAEPAAPTATVPASEAPAEATEPEPAAPAATELAPEAPAADATTTEPAAEPPEAPTPSGPQAEDEDKPGSSSS